jgi:hypothetical protein
MSKSTPGLLAAIEGYSAEHAGSPEHESNISLLKRVAGEIKRGKGDATNDSPGAREARAAAQVNMGAEEGHDGGDGNKTSNRPGSFATNEETVDPQDASKGTRTMSGTGPVPSEGHLRSNLTAAAAPSGVIDIRRGAALKALESERSSGGNAHSNRPGNAPGNEKRIGDVESSGKTPLDRNKGSFDDGKVPLAGKDSLAGDGWGKAAARAKKLAPSR